MNSQLQHEQAFFEPPRGCEEDKNPILPNLSQMRAVEIMGHTAHPPQPPAFVANTKSTTSSALARRKQLELEAAREEARIRMELLDKQLEADLAELDLEKYSSHLEKHT